MTRYADRLLADGERVVLRARQHWLAPFVEGRVQLAIFFASIVLLVLLGNIERGTFRDVLGFVALGLLILALVWLFWEFLSWYSQDYLVTNRRVLKVEGILRKRSADSSLEKINDAVLEQGILGRMLGYGDLDILTAAETSVDQYRMLAEAQQFKRTMLDEKHSLEEEFTRVPAPPLRAAPLSPVAPSAPAAAAPALAPAAPAPVAPQAPATPSLSAQEITNALGNLADLRDRGAISPEEYEAKKQDLLGRL
ncbi:MAG TPA: PH domain-containing protein [Candidatus Limnocylindrales bacterium]|nr:PH domain-containing protein [Candidatus Limnocylindrales bacterium]